MGQPFAAALTQAAEIVEEALDRLLPKTGLAEAPLVNAMRYACLGGGKRLRPLLVLTTARLFAVASDSAARAAAAVEMLHCYSLIHDDLPAMDNSDLRRGRATVHRQFDEATAILAGDALLTLAFEVLADPATHEDPAIRCRLVSDLAKAAGRDGMVGGQMLDLLAEKQSLDAAAITRLQRLKTVELIGFACEAGAVLGRASPPYLLALRGYAHDLGLAYQMTDDLLDAEGSSANTGKTVGLDAAAGKATFVSILGPERARGQAELLCRQAIKHLDIFEGRAEVLQQLAEFVIERRA